MAAALLPGIMPLRAAPAPAFPDKLELVALLRAGNFDELERRLTARQDRYELGDENKVTFAFEAFANSARDLETQLNSWVGRRKTSFAARAARGMYYQKLGWLSRRFRYIAKTRPEQLRAMRRYFEKARADFTAALRLRPRLGLAYAKLYGMAVADGTKEERNAILRRGFAADPGSPPLYRARMWSLRPNWLGSLKEMQAFARLADTRRLMNHRVPNLESEITLTRASSLSRRGQYREAVRRLSEALDLDATKDLYIARGKNHRRLGHQEKAIADFTRALALAPQNETALIARAWSHQRLKNNEAALADLSLAIALDRLNPKPLRRRADLQRSLKRFDAALKDLDDAMVYGGYNPRTVELRGGLHLSHTKDYRAAVRDFIRATELAPRIPRHWYNLAVAYHRLKDCKTVEATIRYLDLCTKGGRCAAKRVGIARTVMSRFLQKNEACRAHLPPPPPLWERLWTRFKAGLVKTVIRLFLKAKAE